MTKQSFSLYCDLVQNYLNQSKVLPTFKELKEIFPNNSEVDWENAINVFSQRLYFHNKLLKIDFQHNSLTKEYSYKHDENLKIFIFYYPDIKNFEFHTQNGGSHNYYFVFETAISDLVEKEKEIYFSDNFIVSIKRIYKEESIVCEVNKICKSNVKLDSELLQLCMEELKDGNVSSIIHDKILDLD